MRRFNIFNATVSYEEDDPPGFRSGYANVASELGAEELAQKVYELPPGESMCPYHYEYVEEWLIVLEGRPTVRHPGGEDVLEPGDTVCFPSGPEGAHKVTNRTGERARLIMFSSGREPAVAVYPDSDKIGVWPGRKEDKIMVRRSADVDYWDGERDGEPG
jgi:uncharacterized cupin superfamily protein